jgi:hypothetical protein
MRFESGEEFPRISRLGEAAFRCEMKQSDEVLPDDWSMSVWDNEKRDDG